MIAQSAGAGLLLVVFSTSARADPRIELSGAAGFGALAVGVTAGRFAISPSASFSVRGEGWFFVARDTVSSSARRADGSGSKRDSFGCSSRSDSCFAVIGGSRRRLSPRQCHAGQQADQSAAHE